MRNNINLENSRPIESTPTSQSISMDFCTRLISVTALVCLLGINFCLMGIIFLRRGYLSSGVCGSLTAVGEIVRSRIGNEWRRMQCYLRWI
jgi:hypothetical protein